LAALFVGCDARGLSSVDAVPLADSSVVDHRSADLPETAFDDLGPDAQQGPYVYTLAGNTEGYADGPAHLAKFSHPMDVAVDAAGRVYVAEQHRVRLIENGVVTTLAGSGKNGCDDGPAHLATFKKAAWTTSADLDVDYQKLGAKVANIIKGPVGPGLKGKINAVEKVVEAFLRKHGIPEVVFARALLDQPNLRAGLLKILGKKGQTTQADLQILAADASQVVIS